MVQRIFKVKEKIDRQQITIILRMRPSQGCLQIRIRYLGRLKVDTGNVARSRLEMQKMIDFQAVWIAQLKSNNVNCSTRCLSLFEMVRL